MALFGRMREKRPAVPVTPAVCREMTPPVPVGRGACREMTPAVPVLGIGCRENPPPVPAPVPTASHLRYTRRDFSARGGTGGRFSRHAPAAPVRGAAFPGASHRGLVQTAAFLALFSKRWYRRLHFSRCFQNVGTAGGFSRREVGAAGTAGGFSRRAAGAAGTGGRSSQRTPQQSESSRFVKAVLHVTEHVLGGRAWSPGDVRGAAPSAAAVRAAVGTGPHNGSNGKRQQRRNHRYDEKIGHVHAITASVS